MYPGLVVVRERELLDSVSGDVVASAAQFALERVLEPLGGMRRFVRPGGTVLVKPDAAFAVSPRGGAVTDPAMLAAVVRSAREVGAAQVIVADNPIAAPALAFERTGMRRAVEQAGGVIALPLARDFQRVRIAGATVVRDWPFFVEVLARADCLIGMAPVKDHNLCGAAMTMKNWFGLLGGRRERLYQRIHQAICDLWRAVRPFAPLLILDGTRVLARSGPTGGGPGDVVVRATLAAGTDPVAVDAFGVSLLERDPRDVPYLAMAQDAGFGAIDFTRGWVEL